MIAGLSMMQMIGERVVDNVGQLARRVIPVLEEDEGSGSGFVLTHVEGHRRSVPPGGKEGGWTRSEMGEMELPVIEKFGAFFRTRPSRMLDPVNLSYGQ